MGNEKIKTSPSLLSMNDLSNAITASLNIMFDSIYYIEKESNQIYKVYFSENLCQQRQCNKTAEEVIRSFVSKYVSRYDQQDVLDFLKDCTISVIYFRNYDIKKKKYFWRGCRRISDPNNLMAYYFMFWRVELPKNFSDSVKQERNYIEQIECLEKEIESIRIQQKLFRHRMKEHFLYNTLNSIKAMVAEDTQKANEMIFDFSVYLRGNQFLCESPTFIDFATELKYVKSYINLELVRFPKVKVVYEIEETGMYVPPLCVQILVENAFLYGVAEKKENAIICISSRSEVEYDTISVSDNGVGFHVPPRLSEPGFASLYNIQNMVEEYCHGYLVVESKIGEGTQANLYLPKMNRKERG